MQRDNTGLIALLRKTLQDVQDSLLNDSTEIQELKRCLLRTIAELESELKTRPVA